MPVTEEVEEPFAQGIVMDGTVVAEELGNGTVAIGLSPVVSVSVAPSGIVLPITLELEVEGWVEEAVLLDVVAQGELGVIPPPSKVDEADDMLLIPLADEADGVMLIPPAGEVDDELPMLVELIALQDELTVGPRPPGLISVAPSGTTAPVALLAALVPNVPIGEVAPIPDGVMVVCALAATHAQSSASTAKDNRRRIEISWSAQENTRPALRGY